MVRNHYNSVNWPLKAKASTIAYFKKNSILDERVNAIRPMVVDGEGMMGTMDYRIDRLNVEIREEKIVKLMGFNWISSANHHIIVKQEYKTL